MKDISQKQPPEVFWKKVFWKILQYSQQKHLCQGPFFNEVAGLKPAKVLKKRFWRSCFPVNFAKFLITSILKNIWTTASDYTVFL